MNELWPQETTRTRAGVHRWAGRWQQTSVKMANFRSRLDFSPVYYFVCILGSNHPHICRNPAVVSLFVALCNYIWTAEESACFSAPSYPVKDRRLEENQRDLRTHRSLLTSSCNAASCLSNNHFLMASLHLTEFQVNKTIVSSNLLIPPHQLLSHYTTLKLIYLFVNIDSENYPWISFTGCLSDSTGVRL